MFSHRDTVAAEGDTVGLEAMNLGFAISAGVSSGRGRCMDGAMMGSGYAGGSVDLTRTSSSVLYVGGRSLGAARAHLIIILGDRYQDRLYPRYRAMRM